MYSSPRARFRQRSADPFWRNRRWFGVAVVMGLIASMVLAGSVTAAPAAPTTTVNSTADFPDAIPGDGNCDTGGTNSAGADECTLRAALEESNANAAVTEILFTLPATEPGHAAGIWTIQPGTVLPDVNESVDIDATSQTGWAGDPLIVLDGSSLGAGDSGLRIQPSAPDSSLQGFSVVAFPDNGVMSGADRTTISDNHIGVMPDGTTSNGNATEGIIIWDGTDSVIDNNLIGGQGNGAIVLSGAVTGTTVTGNTIGTDGTGTINLGNGQGVWIDSTGSNRIGGVGAGEGNTIANSTFHAIDIEPAANQATILGNSIFDNGDLAINLSGAVEDGFGVTANDVGDGDAGPNDLLNYPVLTSATHAGGTVTVDFDLDVPAGNYRFEIFSNPAAADPSLHGEGETFVHAYAIVGHPGGSASYSISYAGPTGGFVAATTTEDFGGGTFGATSEFSQASKIAADAITVNSTGDAGDTVPGDGSCDTGALVGTDPECTLRAAIEEANALAGTDAIEFAIPQTDSEYTASPESFTIRPSTLLPTISTPMILDASTQPEYATNSRPVIEVDGTNVSAGEENGFYLTGGGTTMRGFAINNWGDDAIDVEFNGNNTIVGNYIGTNVTGTASEPNAWGINFKTGGNVIGGNTVADRNVVSGNTYDGLYIYTSSATGNVVQGNYIGTNAAGTSSLSNGGSGIYVHSGAFANTIGGATSAHGNVISGNGPGDAGVLIEDATTSGNIVQYNRIGTNANGDAAIPNDLHGIRIENAPGTMVLDNLISGNNVHGIYNFDSGSTGTQILRNTIGANLAATAALPNGFDGVRLEAWANSAIIGSPGNGNIVSGNSQHGINANSSSNNTIQANAIGTNLAGTLDLGNGWSGVYSDNFGSSNNLVGGDTAAAANLIAFNDEGVTLLSGADNAVLGNSIWGNTGLAIDLEDDGVTANDGGDGDGGPNDLLNFPVITSATAAGPTVTVDFDLDAPASTYRIEFYTNPAGADGSGNGEGEAFADAATIVHSGGEASHSGTFTGVIGDIVTATATEQSAGPVYGATSEFSAAATVVSGGIFVNSTGDDGDDDPGDGSCDTGNTNTQLLPECTLRAAIEEANALPGSDPIGFNMPASELGHSGGVWTISPLTALPDITEEATIDATTQTGWATTPVVELNGSGAGGGVDGLRIAGDTVEIRGLAVNRFGGDGIKVLTSSSGSLIAGNHVGLDAAGLIAYGNLGRGIDLQSASGPTTVGGAAVADRNVISASGDNGVIVFGSDNNVIIGNYIGTDVTGNASSAAIGNGADGISLDGGSSGNTVGAPGALNVLSGNAHDGVEVGGIGAANRIRSNMIGLGADGTTVVANGRHGIVLYNGANNNEIGGVLAGQGNTISGNAEEGIRVDGNANAGTTANVIHGNFIGTDATGNLDRGNGTYGINIFDMGNATVIGSAGAGNVISGNGEDGIYLSDLGTDATVIQGNLLGTNAAGTAAIRNDDRGLQIENGASFTQVGGSGAGEGNVISGNNGDGMIIADWLGLGTTGTIVEGNLIGVASDGVSPLGNGAHGLHIDPVSGNHIGGTALGASNTIANNALHGIRVAPTAGTNTIMGNSIYANGGLGIDLADDGVTTNDAGDGDSGPNDLLNFPVITSATASGPTVTVDFDLDLPAGTYHVQFFTNPSGADPSGYGEGEVHQLTYVVVSHPGGTASFSTSYPGAAGDLVTATTTEVSAGPVYGGTSEFSASFTVTGANTAPVLDPVVDQTIDEQTLLVFTATGSDPDLDGLTFSLTGEPTGAAITAGGDFTFTPTETQGPGSYTFDVIVTDDGTPALADTETITVTVNEANVAPVVTNPGNQTDAEADIISLFVVGTDADVPLNTLTWSATGLPPGMSINPGTGEISGTLSYTSAGSHPVSITATDNGSPNLADTVNFTWTVTNTNRAPVLTIPGTQNNGEGDTVNLPIVGSDPDGDPLTWSANNLPAGLTINPVTGVITGTITYDAAGTYSSSVTAFDGINASAVFFTWTVTNTNRAPVMGTPLDQTNAEGDPISMSIAASDPDGDVLTWSATGLPSGLTINPVGGGITGTLDAASAGVHTVTVTATDPGLLFDDKTFTWTVTDTNQSPVLDPVGAQSVDEQTLLSFTATGSDPDLDGLTFTLAGEPIGAAISPTGDFTFTPTEAQGPGTYTFDVVLTDDGTPTLTDTETITVTVNETNTAPSVTNPGNQSNAETDAVSLFVNATDADVPLNTLTWSATGLPDGVSINPGTGEISGTLTYTSAGSHSVSITTTDDGTPALADTTNFTWDVTNTNRIVVITYPGSQTNVEGDIVNLPIVGVDADGDTITWSAGNLPTGLTIDPVTGIVSGTITFDAAGTYSSNVTAFDGTNSTAAFFTWTVTDTNRAPVITTTWNSSTFGEGSVITMTIIATDPDGDAVTWTAPGLPPGLVLVPSTGFVSGTVDPNAGGVYPVTFTATDPGGLTDTHVITFTVTKTNSAPALAPVADQSNAETDVVSLAVAASDPDSEDTLAFSALNLPDGLSIDPASGLITGTLTYDSAGTHTVDITVTDDGAPAQSDTTTFTWTVTDTNRAPEIKGPLDQASAEGDTISLTINGDDSDGDTITWSATNLPSTVSIDPSSGLVTGTIGYSAAGSYSASVTAFDGLVSTVSTFTWDVANTNRSPVVSSIGDQENDEGDTISLTPTGSDPDGDTLTWTAIALPDGLTINPTTGEISGVLSPTSSGEQDVTITATDPLGLSDSTTFEWEIDNTAPINRPPVIAAAGPQSWTELDVVSVILTASDPDGDTLTWSAANLPAGLSINTATGEISGTLPYDSLRDVESTILVSDGTAFASTFVDWSILNLNRPPVIANPGSQTSVVGDTVTLTLSASDADNDALTFSATHLLPGLTLNPSTGAISGSPAVEAHGTGPVIFTVDDGTDTDSVTINWDVTLAPVATTTTTSTTIAPTTTTTAVVAPTTVPGDSSSPPTTKPSDEPTEALPFSDFQAHDDQITVTAAERIIIDVRSNDVGGDSSQIVALSVPEFGELDVVNGELILDLPAGFVGQFTFLYSVENDSGEVSTAEVKVFAASTVATNALSLDAAPVVNASDVLRRFGSLVLKVLKIDLSALQLGALLISPFIYLLLRFLFGKREKLVSVNSVALGAGADALDEDAKFHLRHDATVWKLKRGNRQVDGVNQVLVETPNGLLWIDADLVVDTGH